MKFGRQPASVVDTSEDELDVHQPKKEAAGVKAVNVARERAVPAMYESAVIRKGDAHYASISWRTLSI